MTPSAAAPGRADAAMTSALQVLILDRDRQLCATLAGVLSSNGYRVDCLSGSPSLADIQALAPDLLVLDIPAAPGPETELLKRLSRQPGDHLPVIVTCRQPELEFELLDVFDVLPKPLDEERLLEDVALLADRIRRPSRLTYPRLSEVDLALFQDFLVSHSGLHFDRRNALLLERGLQRRMRAVRAGNYRDYFTYLERYRESRQELKKLLGLLTIGETYFFRYLAHFKVLQEQVLPRLLVEKRHLRRLRIWSAGCSSGEEPYSVAMLIREHFPALLDWDLEILATDVNKRALAAARQGNYGPRALRATDATYRERYFRRQGDRYQLVDEVREMVRFRYLNLQTGTFPDPAGSFDAIFCRNVMIYFRPETTRQLVGRLARVLQPGGSLFLGHAETLLNIRHDFARVQYGGGFHYRLQPPGEAAAEAARDSIASPPRDDRPPRARPAVAPSPLPPRASPKPPKPPERHGTQGPPDLAELFVAAKKAFEEENFRTASQSYAILLRHNPEHVGALVGYGFLLANQGDFAAARTYCRRALAVDDLCPEVYFLQGLVEELEDRPREALAEYRRALLLDMSQVIPHYSLSRVYRRLDRHREAMRELRNTLRLLERLPPDEAVPYAGGWTPRALGEQCRRELAQLAQGTGAGVDGRT